MCIRDRYRDEIQCAGAKVVDAVRAHSRALGNDGTFYALHIRRGDFQFKAVKISAAEIVENLRGTSIIPRGALVYLATDDPDGVCKGCWANKKPCKDQLGVEGCPKDASWDAFVRNGWHVTVLRNYTEATHGTNPTYFGKLHKNYDLEGESNAKEHFSWLSRIHLRYSLNISNHHHNLFAAA